MSAALEAELMRRVVWLLDCEGFEFRVNAIRVVQLAVSFHAMLEPKPSTYREFWSLADQAVDLVKESMAEEASWDEQEAAWRESGGYWLDQDL
jgi:hypothetical protein